MPTRCINRSLRRRQSASRSKPMMETLEPRQLLSAAVADAQPYLGNILHLAPALATGPLAGATPSNTEVTSNAVEESAVYGSTITLTATVSDETATGAVTFFDGTTSLGTGTVGVGGTWTLDVATLHAGAHSITAVYGGDETFDPSTSSIYTLTITAKPLTVTGITAANKTYDRLTTATLTTTNADLVGVLQDDIANVTLVKTNASGNFADASAATGSTVIVSGLTISGSAAGDYSLTQPTTTADITPIALTVTGITAGNKTYDRLTTATLTTTSASLVGVLAGDTANVTLVKTNATGNFADANVGNGKTVTITGLTLSGSAAGNYTVTNPSATANVSALTITVSGVTANKTYDGTTTATLNLTNAVLNTVIAGDTQNVTLTAANATASFASAGVGNGKTVTLSGLALTGSAAANYILTQPSITANIAAKALTVTGITAANKVYDHLTTATLTTTGATLVGVVAGDAANVTLVKTNASGNFADANVGNGKTVTLSGLTISGSAAANYTITQPTTTANITPKTLTLTGVTAANKVYNGSAAATLTIGTLGLTGVITADLANVSAVNGGAAGAFSSANVGNGKTVTITGVTLGGDAASNYTLAATTTANITPKTITVSGITGNNKVYDGSTAATFSIANAIVSGVLASDNANVTLTGTTGAFANANAGTAKAITPTGLTLSGSAAGNYTLTQPAITANITPKGLTITGIKAANKVYDHTTTATLTTSSAAISGLVAGDSNKVTLV
ncbi:MAG TPA: YDG domain-containing protein, partial [Phycisphaerae bacterium]|nr:YDG domain-containing protein [Phycisphaerae bacterium]